MVQKSILKETQEDRDRELAAYLHRPIEEISSIKVEDMEGPPIWNGDDFRAESYAHLYEKFEFADEATALKAFSLFIVLKRGKLVREACARAAPVHNKHVLDFGCGVGSHGIHFLQEGAEGVDFLDVEGPAFRFCKYRLQQRQFKGTYGTLYPGSELPSQKYDVVLLIDVLEHVANPVLVFQRVMKSVKSGGLVCLQFGKNPNPKQGHFRQSRMLWLSKRSKKIRGKKLAKLSDYFFRRR